MIGSGAREREYQHADGKERGTADHTVLHCAGGIGEFFRQ